MAGPTTTQHGLYGASRACLCPWKRKGPPTGPRGQGTAPAREKRGDEGTHQHRWTPPPRPSSSPLCNCLLLRLALRPPTLRSSLASIFPSSLLLPRRPPASSPPPSLPSSLFSFSTVGNRPHALAPAAS